MRYKRLRWLSMGGILLGWIVACSYPDCPYGIVPFPGQTAVALDTVVEIRARGPLPRDLPSLNDAVGLQREDGSRVPVDMEVDLEGGLIRLRPLQPLEPDTTYTAWGISERELDRLHWLGSLPDDSVEATFTTGSAPTLVAALWDAPSMILVFSEAIVPASLEERVWLLDDHDRESDAVTVIGRLVGEPHLVELLVLDDDDADGAFYPRQVRLEEGVVGPQGAPLVTLDEPLWVTWIEGSLDRALRPYRGLARCGGDR